MASRSLKRIARWFPQESGRVVFHEILGGQEDGDRKHIVWVILGSQMIRASVHSVRLCTEKERLQFELEHPFDPEQWKSLADLLPQRQYIDIEDQEPGEDEVEVEVDLPEQPNEATSKLRPAATVGLRLLGKL